MKALPKQFALISKIKNLVRKTRRGFWKRTDDHAVTDSMARKIQKTAFDLSQEKAREVFTPAYVIISDQLQVEDEQIFKAAVYNLARIAIANPQFSEEILAILNTYKDKEEKTAFERDYVKQKISEIRASQAAQRTKKAG